ncbi:small integral membrane protein 20 isoform X2 [Lepidochelys kempii]|uniref:small integral membrane protein 20 isoform X2 n=1 Tax=Lepidochelys kempii TaxID=8472 RepID=UPI003C6FEE8F
MARISRTLLIFGGFAAVVGAAFYPIYFRPLLQVEQYRKEQATNRSGIVQEDVQPPGFADTFEWSPKEGYSSRRHVDTLGACRAPSTKGHCWSK